uniref:Reverse transcriptase domain-containing protein n=1 Tax=Cyclopterus lumpus TaxID=8103 RepID=A0A8C3A210_CYCLU
KNKIKKDDNGVRFEDFSCTSTMLSSTLRGVPPKLLTLISNLYSGAVSAVRCGDTISDFFPVNTGVRQGCVLAPTLFNACMDWILGRMSVASGCGVSFGNDRFSDLDFADDAVIFAESLDVLTWALVSLGEESEPLGLRISWIKTKVQAFNDVLAAAVESVPVCGENVEVMETFTYLGSVVHVSTACGQEVNQRLGRAWGVMDSLDEGVWRSRHLCKRTKVRVFRSLVLPVLLYGCETWTTEHKVQLGVMGMSLVLQVFDLKKLH